MVAISTITWIIGVLAVIVAGVFNYLAVKDEPPGNLRDELNVNMGLLIFGVILSAVFPPLGILALLASTMINIHASALETNLDNHNKLVWAAFLTMAGAILTVLSSLYKGVVSLRPGVEIPGVTIVATILGVLAVFVSAISTYISAGHTQDATIRTELYWSVAITLASLVFLPASYLLRNVNVVVGNILTIISILLLGASLFINVYAAGHVDADTHGWLIGTSIAQAIGIILFTAAIHYIGTVKVAPLVAGLTKAWEIAPEALQDTYPEIESDPILKPLLEKMATKEARARILTEYLKSQAAAPQAAAPQAAAAAAAQP